MCERYIGVGCYRVSLTYCNECEEFSLGMDIVQTPHQHWEEYRLRLALVQLWLMHFVVKLHAYACLCSKPLTVSRTSGLEQLDLVQGVALLLN